MNVTSERTVLELADIFKAFGDPTRIKILSALHKNELNVGEIADALGMSQSAISHQLNVLKRSKLIKSRRDGKTVYYSLECDHVYEIIRCGIEHIDE